MKSTLLRVALLGLLAGCSSNDDPTPTAPTSGLNLPAEYVVQVRVTGAGLTGLGARVQTTVSSAPDGQPPVVNPAQGRTDSYPAATVSQTYDLVRVPRYARGQNLRRYAFRTVVSFQNVRAGGVQPQPGSRLKVELLANGQVIPAGAVGNPTTQVELTAATATGDAPQLTATLQTEFL